MHGTGALLSGACAVHCALTPLLITALPAVANHGAETTFRRVLVIFGILGVGIGAWVHKSREALLPLSWAILLALSFELHWLSVSVEVFPSLLLSGCLITAHALNSRACHKKSQCCDADRCDDPFWGLIGPRAPGKGASNAPIVLSAAILLHSLVIALVVHGAPAAPIAQATKLPEVEVDVAAPTFVPAPEAAAPPPPVALRAAPPVAHAAAVPAAAAPVAFSERLSAPGPTDAAEPVRFASVLGRSALGVPGGVSGGSSAGTGLGNAGAAAGSQGTPSTEVVEARQLSRRPLPPSGLEARIRSHYPSAARAQQIEGTGSARLLVSPSGVISIALASGESAQGSGFAAACADAMRGSTGWGAPLDQSAKAVSTWIHFTCEFAISH
jgi:hypothetical protein